MTQMFSGSSKNNNLVDALEGAINNARTQLRTDLIYWELANVSGAAGGFVDGRDLTATIKAGMPDKKPPLGLLQPVAMHGEIPWPGVCAVSSTRVQELASTAGDPQVEVRRKVQSQVRDGSALPQTKSFELYYLIGLDGDQVRYGPIFAYLIDVGWPMLPSVHVPFTVAGNGDPGFPDFAKAAVFSTPANRDPNHIIFPVQPATLIVGFEAEVPEDQVKTSLTPYGTDIQKLAADTYTLKITKVFHEGPVAAQIQHEVARVRFAEMNSIQRLIDIRPGWKCRRVL